MVDIIVGTVSPVHNQAGKRDDRGRSDPSKKGKQRERRQNRSDRRRSVRDGIVVTLSTESNRRRTPDRRKGGSTAYPPGWVARG